jgi:hypothetical protein
MGLHNKKRNSGTSDMMMKLLAKTKVTDTKVIIGKSSQSKKVEL